MPQIGATLPHRFKQFLERETVCSLAMTLSTDEVHNKGLSYLLQMWGTIGVVSYDDTKSTHAAFMKVAHKLDDPRDAGNTMILFRPTWARYGDWKNSTQEVIAL